MNVKAKFICQSVNHMIGLKAVKLYPVTSGSEENKSFAKYTPGGDLSLQINEGTLAYDFFEPGKEYFLTFDKVE